MEAYHQVISYFPERIRTALAVVPTKFQHETKEIRLRQDRPISLILHQKTLFLTATGQVLNAPGQACMMPTAAEMEESFQQVCGYSVHSYEDQIKNGFITLSGGHRVGLTGTAVSENGHLVALRDISSMNFRIARTFPHVSEKLIHQLYANNLPSVLLSGAPLSGKTTLLKDIISELSSGVIGRFYKIAVIDERNELGAVYEGTPQINLGPCTDVLSGYPKGVGMNIALRTMSPELIVCDEIGGAEETDAVRASLNAGTAVLVTAHAGSLAQLQNRPQIKTLIAEKAFDYIIQLEGEDAPCKIREIFSMNVQTSIERRENPW